MSEPSTRCWTSGEGYVAVIRIVVSVALMATSWQVVAESKSNELSKPASRNELSMSVLDDTELSTIHGKGYRHVVNHENSLSVILWDEGKRKGLYQDRVNGAVSHGQLDVQYNGQQLPK